MRAFAPLFVVAGCATAAPAPHPPGGPQWGYEGATGAERWGGLSAEFAVCETGTTQSPIDLANATRADLPDLRFDYRPTPLHVENRGHTVQVEYQPGSTLMVGGTPYELLQFHFHTPAEHRLQGRELPAELHLVHRGADGGLAVVGVMIERGERNAALAPVWDHLPRNRGEERHVPTVTVHAEALLPAGRQHYRYPGSLTTPPCTEGVQWLVLDQPIQMSAEQIASLRAIIGTSNRPVQPLGARQLLLGT
ncbi:MAG: carbonic anhydrase family protein [Gemmatimonadetes bacterium]|nr:carbonic anhydrase family protein [Gemmatimonadota bacterium]